jgi:hypothetical protein
MFTMTNFLLGCQVLLLACVTLWLGRIYRLFKDQVEPSAKPQNTEKF